MPADTAEELMKIAAAVRTASAAKTIFSYLISVHLLVANIASPQQHDGETYQERVCCV